MASNLFRSPAPRGKPIGKRIRFRHFYKPRKRPAARIYRIEIVRSVR